MESQRLLIGVLVVGVMIAALAIGNPTITGYVPSETITQPLNIDVSYSQRFLLLSEQNLKISSFAISGEVVGKGLVNAYLTDGEHRFLVFSNKKKKGSSLSQITGLMTAEIQIRPDEALKEIESVPQGYEPQEGVFRTQCVETCVLGAFGMQWYLDIIIEPGTTLHISEVQFSGSIE